MMVFECVYGPTNKEIYNYQKLEVCVCVGGKNPVNTKAREAVQRMEKSLDSS